MISRALGYRPILALATAGLVAACAMPPANSKYASKGHCERATGSLVCNPEPDGPETGNGLSQPGVLNNLQGLPGGAK
jgi:hypothetical protein